MNKMKKVMLLILIAVLTLLVLQSIVSATDTPLNITSALNNTTGNNNTSGTTDLPILTSNNQQSTNGTNSTNNTTNNTSTNNVINNTEKLPQTGLTEDITIMFFIVLCVASAVFAYVKIRRYNDR